MEEPTAERRAETDETPPDFAELQSPAEVVTGDRTRDHFFDVVVGLTEPATVSEIAERAGHGVDAAREYAEWFEQIGIVRRRSDSPATYERNQSYFDWRRVDRLCETYATEELLDRLERDANRAEAFAEQFGVESPADVSLSSYAAETGQSVETVWEDLSAWRTVRRRIGLIERALQREPADAVDRQPVG